MSGIRHIYRTLTKTFFLLILTCKMRFVNPPKWNFFAFYHKNAAERGEKKRILSIRTLAR